MNILKYALLVGALSIAAPAMAQIGGNVSGLGGAKEQMFPSTVGADPRPDRETMRASSGVQRDPGAARLAAWLLAPPSSRALLALKTIRYGRQKRGGKPPLFLGRKF